MCRNDTTPVGTIADKSFCFFQDSYLLDRYSKRTALYLSEIQNKKL